MLMYEFGKYLKYYRKQERITQQELALILHVDQSLISLWERNICEPNMETLIKLCALFDMDLYYVLQLETDKQRENVLNSLNIPNNIKSNLSVFQNDTDNTQSKK